MGSRKKSNLFIKGFCVDNDTGQKIHSFEGNNIEDFDEFFTKPMRRKLL